MPKKIPHSLFAHLKKQKPLPKIKSAHQWMDAVLHLSPTQLSLFDAVIRHAAGKDKMDERFYPGLSRDDFKELQGFSAELYDDLLSHTHSTVALAVWHRRHMKGGGPGWTMVKKIGGKIIDFGRKAWNTVSKIGKKLASYGKKLGQWVINNPEKIAAIAEMIQSGIAIKDALTQGGAPAAIESAASQVTESAEAKEKMSKYDDDSGPDSDLSDAGSENSAPSD